MTDDHQSHRLEHDYTSANEAYFDAEALKVGDHPRRIKLAERICDRLKDAYPGLLDEDTTEVMDFACGTGLTSMQLCPHVKSIVGVDISQNAVDAYNARATQQGLMPEEMRAVRTLIQEEEAPELAGIKFDVIISVASYHHLPHIDATSRILSRYLKLGGSLLIADILNEDIGTTQHDTGLPEKYKDIVAHKSGFTEAEIRNNLKQAGLVDIDFTMATNAFLHGKKVKFFLAKGTNRAAGNALY